MGFATKAHHKHLGDVLITEECYALQSQNPDISTFFVEFDGEVREVTKKLVTPVELTWIDGS